jgi:hypothetical protein
MPYFLLHTTFHDSDKAVRKQQQNCVRFCARVEATKYSNAQRFPILSMLTEIREWRCAIQQQSLGLMRCRCVLWVATARSLSQSLRLTRLRARSGG